METDLIFGLTAMFAIIPAIALSWRGQFCRDFTFFAVTALACTGPLLDVIVRSDLTWHADFSTSIWVTITITMALFLFFSAVVRNAWQLAPLLNVYMLILAVIAFAWQNIDTDAQAVTDGTELLVLHIGFAVTTYGLVTLAAVAGLAAFLQERALKQKRKPILDGTLPSITDCDRLVSRFLMIGEAILGLGLITGIVLNISLGEDALTIDHKTVFSLATFVTIGALLYAQSKHGLRGRRASRFVLLAYLLLTLGYPGVKFVSTVLALG